MKENLKIVILATRGDKANILYHRLAEKYQVEKVFIEDSVPRKQLIKRRMKKLGWKKVTGQILFKLFVSKPLDKKSKPRLQQIKAEYHMDASEIPMNRMERVSSVNDVYCIEKLKEIQPDIIVVNGTRIISKEVLQAVKVPFLNMHAGITPLYRGVHGGYWALANQDKEHCGVTVHYIDEGIDTGSVIYQSLIEIGPDDNFSTYPYLQFALGLQDMVQAIEDYRNGGIHTTSVNLPSKFRTHPTLGEYLYYKRKYGVR